jgi:hypothetical protein
MLQFSYCCHHCYSIVSIARLVFINATLSHHTSPPSFFQSIDNPSLPLLTSSVSQVIDISHFHPSLILSSLFLMASTDVFLLHHSFFANAPSSQDIGHEKSSFLDDLLATLQTYQMEFDARCVCIVSFRYF